MFRTLLFAFGLATLLAGPAFAHHGWSSYDANKTLTFDAPLQEVRMRNPHADAVVEYEGERWEIVLAPVSRMTSRGLQDGQLVVGKTITIVAYPRLDGTREMRAERIVVDDTTIELR